VIQLRFIPFALKGAKKNAALDRNRNSELHFENTGCCHPNLRSLQLSLFLSVLNLGSTPGGTFTYS
jgi:hypothetical protein